MIGRKDKTRAREHGKKFGFQPGNTIGHLPPEKHYSKANRIRETAEIVAARRTRGEV